MPTYEYSCTAGHHFEQFQRMSEAPLETCPQCGAPAQRQLSAGAGLLFKGSGFYITDYRSDSYRKDAAKDSGGSDSKPADGKSSKESSSKDSSSNASSPKQDSGSKPAKSE